jgi:hypothetical protein
VPPRQAFSYTYKATRKDLVPPQQVAVVDTLDLSRTLKSQCPSIFTIKSLCKHVLDNVVDALDLADVPLPPFERHAQHLLVQRHVAAEDGFKQQVPPLIRRVPLRLQMLCITAH